MSRMAELVSQLDRMAEDPEMAAAMTYRECRRDYMSLHEVMCGSAVTEAEFEEQVLDWLMGPDGFALSADEATPEQWARAAQSAWGQLESRNHEGYFY